MTPINEIRRGKQPDQLAVSGHIEHVVMLHGSDELPKDRRECLVTTYFGVESYLAKYNEVTERWMVAFEKEMSMTNAQIRTWVYVDEIFAT